MKSWLSPGCASRGAGWHVASEPPADGTPLLLDPGAQADVVLRLAFPPGPAKLWIHAMLSGAVGLRVPGQDQEVRMQLSSKAIPVSAADRAKLPHRE